MTDYRGVHTAPGPGSGQRLDTLGREWEVYPLNVIDRPDLYSLECKSTADVVRTVHTKVSAGIVDVKVQIYRAVPPGVTVINTGDWVALSREYAIQQSLGLLDATVDDGSGDGVVISATVSADELFSEGYIEEWGYQGRPILNLSASTHKCQ